MVELDRIICGDCLEELPTLPEDSIDAIVTDPPAGIAFMGKEWDKDKGGRNAWIAWMCRVASECLRVIKPGGHALVWALPRTSHWTGMAWEEAGWEPRDKIAHVFGSGFPKSLDISKKIDQMFPRMEMFDEFAKHFSECRSAKGLSQKEIAVNFPSKTGGLTGCVWNWENGANVPTLAQWEILQPILGLSDEFRPLIERIEAERETIGVKPWTTPVNGFLPDGRDKSERKILDITAPATPAAKQWAGWGSAIKPAHEDWWLFRKPLAESTIAANVLWWGCGGLNIDGCRVGYTSDSDKASAIPGGRITTKVGAFAGRSQDGKDVELDREQWKGKMTGRFPANLIHDGSPEVLAEFAKAGERKCGKDRNPAKTSNSGFTKHGIRSEDVNYGDTGSAARFFQSCSFTEEDIPAFMYYAKSSRSERNAGLDRTCTVKLITDNDLIDGVCQKDVNMVAVQLLQKVTSDLGVMKWNIGESGESISALCPLDSLSTILTEINRIIESRTLDLLMHSLISESTQGVNLSMENGGNLAANVENLRKWILTITDEKTAFALGASRVALKMLSQTSEKGSWQSFTNFHSTVKPLSLMRYLCRLITPPDGVVLDPFAGSGTTCMAAKAEGFHYLGIEREAEYVEIARRRIATIPTSLRRWEEDAR